MARLTEGAQELAAAGTVESRVGAGLLDSLDGLGSLDHNGRAPGDGGGEHLLLHEGGHFERLVGDEDRWILKVTRRPTVKRALGFRVNQR